MTIEITSNNGWISADLIDWDGPVSNLYTAPINPHFGLMSAYQEASSSVHFNYPQYKNVRIVTDLGQGVSTI